MGLVGSAKAQAKELARQVVAATAPPREGLAPSTWGLSRAANGSLVWEGVALESLVKEHGSPLHVVNWRKLEVNARAFMATPSGTSAGCEVYASYKTNPVPKVLKALHDFGFGAEVISAYEYWLARKLGMPHERIIYNGPVKSRASVEDAVKGGVGLLGANHAEELDVFAQVAQAAGKRPRVAVRVAPPAGWSAQFGAPMSSGAALSAVEKALSLSAQLDVVGLHAHRGGMIRSEDALVEFVDAVLAFTEVVADKTGHVFSVLDFGGSLGSPTVEHLSAVDLRLNRTLFRDLPAPDTGLSIDRYLQVLVTHVEAHFSRKGWARPRLVIEPGRAVTSNAQLLLTSVHTLKNDGDRPYAILDAGINHAESVRSEYHQLLRVSAPRPNAASHIYSVVGPICTPGDWLYHAQRLEELVPGDVLAIMDSGAYFVPFATSFSYPQPAIVAVAGGRVTTVRRAETFEDLIVGDGL